VFQGFAEAAIELCSLSSGLDETSDSQMVLCEGFLCRTGTSQPPDTFTTALPQANVPALK
jgi:hypothetical protein